MKDFAQELQNLGSYDAHARIKTVVGEAQERLRALSPTNNLLKLIVVAEKHMEFCPGFCEATARARRPDQDGMYLAVANYVELLNNQIEALA